jgi:hypothetical protein
MIQLLPLVELHKITKYKLKIAFFMKIMLIQIQFLSKKA